ncbi:ATP-binding protein [Pararhizobium haloflavum]|uniref:ATP-binding protein n=1 Tax=Pararhizobium haloflavum TaxID=2037914 RepID=UPI0018E49B96|nr:ATP-binding protein [Pararhizobium haloflavum]
MNDETWTISLRKPADVAHARKIAMQALDAAGASAIVKTRFVTAVSEIARNAIVHASSGVMVIGMGRLNGNRSIIARCEDRGPGIVDTNAALKDGFSTGRGMGLGLGGSKRLVDRFELETRVGEGTTVVLETRLR